MPKPKLYTRNCNHCQQKYTGRGKQFCSKKCSNLFAPRKELFIKKLKGNQFAKGKHWKLTQEQRRQPLKTLEPFVRNRLGKHFTAEHRKNISIGHKRLVAEGKHHAWKGGITPKHQAIRNSMEYRLWREAVFKRDDWTCIFCGARSKAGQNIRIEADHIKPFALYPELRFAIDNGRTLCKDCHNKITFPNK